MELGSDGPTPRHRIYNITKKVIIVNTKVRAIHAYAWAKIKTWSSQQTLTNEKQTCIDIQTCYCKNNILLPSYSATYTFSPTTASLQHLFSREHFFYRYSLLIPLRKNTQTPASMASELSTDSTDISTSFNSSSATSKVNVKGITRLPSQITSNIIIPV